MHPADDDSLDLAIPAARPIDSSDLGPEPAQRAKRREQEIERERGRRAGIYAARVAELGAAYDPYEWIDAKTTRRREREMDARLDGRTIFGDTYTGAIEGYFGSDVDLDEIVA